MYNNLSWPGILFNRTNNLFKAAACIQVHVCMTCKGACMHGNWPLIIYYSVVVVNSGSTVYLFYKINIPYQNNTVTFPSKLQHKKFNLLHNASHMICTHIV